MSSMTFNWRRVMIKEYNSTYIWMTGAVLLIAKDVYDFHGMPVVEHYRMFFVSLLILLLAGYLFVRYMKKSKRWIAG